MLRDVLAVRGECFSHDAEDVQAALTSLFERLAHHQRRDTGELDVHLQGGDARGRAGHLEVHVAVVVFSTGDVGEHRELAAGLVHHQAHRDTGHRRLERHTGVHHRERRTAHRRHRRRAVRLEDVGDDTHRVGEVLFTGDHAGNRALREGAVADFAAARAGHAAHFTNREGREVVVQHEVLPGFPFERLDLLRVVGCAERAGDERLRFATREHG